MSDISANIVVQPYDITISTTTNTIELSPQVIDMTVVNGYVGATGPTGATGATGLTGATGIQGSTGPVGIGFKTTSTTSLNTSTGTKTLTIGTGLPYVAGQGVLISLDGFSNMYGVVTSYDSSNGQMVANIQRFDGSGTHISWVVDLMGLIGATGATGLEGATGPSGGPTGATGATGPGVTVYDEGNIVSANIASIDFVGSGVLANATGNAVTVTISATPAGANYEIQYKDGTVFGATGSLIWDVANNSTKTVNLIVDNQITSNTANIAGNVTAGNVYANTGTIGANLLTGTLTTNAQPNITSVGNLTSLAVTGNITSGNANLGNLAIANFITGTLTINAQPNITSVGNLTSLTVTGNANISNNIIANGNITANNFIGNITATIANVANNVVVTETSSNTIMYPVFVSNTGNRALQLDSSGFALVYYPFSGVLQVDKVAGNLDNTGGEIVGLDGTNAKIAMSVTGSNNAMVISNATAILESSKSASAATDTTISHKIPIVLNGVTYYIALTTNV